MKNAHIHNCHAKILCICNKYGLICNSFGKISPGLLAFMSNGSWQPRDLIKSQRSLRLEVIQQIVQNHHPIVHVWDIVETLEGPLGPFQYHLKVSKAWYQCLEFLNHSEIWQAPQQHCCWVPAKFQSDFSNLTPNLIAPRQHDLWYNIIRCFIQFWNWSLITFFWYLTHR